MWANTQYRAFLIFHNSDTFSCLGIIMNLISNRESISIFTNMSRIFHPFYIFSFSTCAWLITQNLVLFPTCFNIVGHDFIIPVIMLGQSAWLNHLVGAYDYVLSKKYTTRHWLAHYFIYLTHHIDYLGCLHNENWWAYKIISLPFILTVLSLRQIYQFLLVSQFIVTNYRLLVV